MTELHKTNVLEEVKEITNPETGEVTIYTTKKVYKVKTQQDEFFQIYCRWIQVLTGVKPYEATRLFFILSDLMHRDNKVYITKSLKLKICEELGIKLGMYYVYLKALIKAGLVKGEEGTYELNPELVWKGKDRTRLAKISDFKVTFELPEEKITE